MKTLFIGQNAVHLKSVGSTNTYASEMLRQIGLTEGQLFYTFDQQNGRGQRGNAWETEPHKNLGLSLYLTPNFLSVEKQFMLTKIVSLAVADLMAETLKNSGVEAKVNIKWPNDIYVNGKKIAGILIENNLRESSIQNSIIGVGINVNQTVFSNELKNATSLKLLADKEFDLSEIIHRFCELMEGYYLQLRGNGTEKIDVLYLEKLFQINEWRNYFSGNHSFEGKLIGVNSLGKLKIEKRNSEVSEYDLKEIVFE